MKLEIYPVRLSKAALDAAPENERLFHFLAGQAANDLNILSKLLLSNANEVKGSSEPEQAASATIGLFLIRQMTSRIYETWKTFETYFPAILRAYEGQWTQESQQAWSSIKSYFSARSLIGQVRIKVGYHADADAVKNGYALLRPEDELVDYMNRAAGNSLYASSNGILTLATLQLSGIEDRESAINRVMADTITAQTWFNAIIAQYFSLFMGRYILQEGDEERFRAGKIELNAPDISDFVVPFFVGYDEQAQASAERHLTERRTKRRLAKSRSRL